MAQKNNFKIAPKKAKMLNIKSKTSQTDPDPDFFTQSSDVQQENLSLPSHKSFEVEGNNLRRF